MGTGTTVAAPARCRDLDNEFFRLVYADDQLVRQEFDALIADVWGGSHQLGSDAGAKNLAAKPPCHADSRVKAGTRTALLADPLIVRYARQRSPPSHPSTGPRVEGEALESDRLSSRSRRPRRNRATGAPATICALADATEHLNGSADNTISANAEEEVA